MKPVWHFRLANGAIRAYLTAVRGVSVEGIENLPESGRAIVAVNHVSAIDPPLTSIAVYPRRFPHYLAKEELFKIRWLGEIWKSWGAIPLNRSRGDLGAIRSAMAVLEDEGCLVVFPEGTRSRTGKPLRAKAGIGLLAKESGAPVVPARVKGTDSLLGPVSIRFGTALKYEGGEGKQEWQGFADKVMDAILKL